MRPQRAALIAGVVHEDGDVAEARARRGKRHADGFFVAHVRDDRLDVGIRAQLGDQLVELGRVAPEDRHGGAVTGELREDIDVDAALFMMIGSVLARSRYGDAPVEPGYARRVVDEMLSGIGAR